MQLIIWKNNNACICYLLTYLYLMRNIVNWQFFNTSTCFLKDVNYPKNNLNWKWYVLMPWLDRSRVIQFTIHKWNLPVLSDIGAWNDILFITTVTLRWCFCDVNHIYKDILLLSSMLDRLAKSLLFFAQRIFIVVIVIHDIRL